MTNSDKPTLLLIDGHSLAFRAFYALPIDSFVTRDGQHTNAIHGFLSMFLSLLAKEKPTHAAVAFDISRFSFRTREYPEYKGTRGETPPEFVGQVPLLQEALAAMSIPTITKEDFEADDILATLATRAAAEGFRVLVVSGDRDTIQLVTDDVTLLYPNARGVSELKRYDPDAVRERYGVNPEQYPEIAALVGETSDNLPGIDKVGEKTAVKWITQYGSLDGIFEHIDEIGGVVGTNLREQRDRAERNRRLNRLVTDLDLPVAPHDLDRRPMDVAAVKQVFERLQFRTLTERVLKIAEAEGADMGEVAETAPRTDLPAVRTLVDEELAAWLRAADQAGLEVAVVVDAPHGQLAAFGLATATESVQVNWAAHRPDYAALEAWLSSDSPKLLADVKSAAGVLAGLDIELNGVVWCSRLAAWLERPGAKSYDLVDLVRDALDESMPQADPNQLVPDTASISPATVAWFLHRLVGEQRRTLPESSAGVLRDIELPSAPVLALMQRTGITVDRAALDALNAELGATTTDIAQRAFAEIGREVNLGSPKQLQEVLFDELGMPKTRATKTGYSTDAAALADLQEAHPHPFLGLLLQHRDATKLRQIVETLSSAIAADGRIHTTYDQTGTTTGRISSTDPNLQNIPVRTEVGHRIRAAFTAGEGFESLLTADYSQIEMRIMAHLSGDEGLIEAFRSGEDLHRFVGARIFSVDPADVTPEMRTKVKAMSYGLAYGLSAFGLSKQLRIDTSEAKQLMADYFARFGAVRDYLRSVVEQARADGYTETIFGRRRPFADLKSTNRVLRENAERQALNAPIQGSAADIMKIAMNTVAEDMARQSLRSRMLLQVHDELVFEVAEGEREALEAIVRERMGAAADLAVPLDVQVGVGRDWDDAAH
ncbi:MAG: DNA polymerase I [Microcella sp.]|uniref:DNA polymerase I n=1 Tax=Microcella sp. TaxID=1913979 RepID=UPI0024C70FC9|nr:DNA polymerase I [Microcella sp.]UYN84245.1 MAG: DNA polymerase I [Microcella sp.]